jgi:hypothetical protein
MLPPKVHASHGRYFYVHQNRWHPLSRVDEGPSALYSRLQEFTGENPGSLGQIFGLFIARAFYELSPASRPEYQRIIETRLQHHFGHMVPDSLEPSHVAQYLELRKNEGAPVGGNRERAVLGSVMSWAMRFGWVRRNPCHGVKRNRERPSKRYVSTADLNDALSRASEPLAELLAVAYLTGFRQTDLLAMQKTAVTAKGLRLRKSKDGKVVTREWTPLLRSIVHKALGRSQTGFVFVGPRGHPWTVSGLQSALRRLKPGFRFRDLRPKAATDAKHNILNHSAQMLPVYLREWSSKALG